jgi:hypothetical protein
MKIENQLVRSGKIEWKLLPEPEAEGVYVKVLGFDEEMKRAPTFLLKFEAGATYPAHRNPAGEENFVLEGDIRFGKEHLFGGNYLYSAPNGNTPLVLLTVASCWSKLPKRSKSYRPGKQKKNG